MSNSPGLWQRAADYFLVRRANQTIIALLIVGALVVIAVWWVRAGGPQGKLADHSSPSSAATHPGGTAPKPTPRKADFIVDLNTAEFAELTELPGVGQVIAERIIERRKKVGPFKSVDELLEIMGIGEKTLAKIKPHVRVK